MLFLSWKTAPLEVPVLSPQEVRRALRCGGDSLLRGISRRTGTRRPSSRCSRPRRCSFELEAGPVVAGGGGSKELEALVVADGGGSKELEALVVAGGLDALEALDVAGGLEALEAL